MKRNAFRNSQLFQITRSGAGSFGRSEELDLAKREFEQRHCTILPALVEVELLHTICKRIHTATFYERTDLGIASESCMKDDTTLGILCFLLNNEKLFHFVQQLTGCAGISSFVGRVYRFSSGSNHYDSWHDDRGDSRRLVGLSLNLTESDYSGGVFELRRKDLDEPIHRARATGFGDALLFQLSEQIEHRVTPVVGPVPRTVLAGWFQTGPDFRLAYSSKPNDRSNTRGRDLD